MKLIACKACHDVVALIPNRARHCYCGQSAGWYVDTHKVKVSGTCVVLGMLNEELLLAQALGSEAGGRDFKWFVIAEPNPTIERDRKSVV